MNAGRLSTHLSSQMASHFHSVPLILTAQGQPTFKGLISVGEQTVHFADKSVEWEILWTSLDGMVRHV
jgi:hypothetical protein